MKLLWSPSAPFARKVMVAAHALGMAERIECVRTPVGPARLNPEVMASNPLNKVPTLLLEDGKPLYDSRVICEYLDALAGGDTLFPRDSEARWSALRRQCLADGLLDTLILRRDEYFRGDGHRSIAHIEATAVKIQAALDAMEAEADELVDASRIDIGHIAIGVALGYLDFRAPDYQWRDGRPRLAGWEAGFAFHPAMRAAGFVDDGRKRFVFYEIG